MVSFLARRPNVTLTYSGPDLAVAALAAAVVAGWAAVAGGAFSLLALAACEVAFLAFYLVGSLFAAWGPLAAGALFDLPLRLLMGYVAVNTALLVLAWLSPLGIVANFGLLFAGAAALFVAARPLRQHGEGGFRRSPGRRPVSGRCHALVPRLAPPDLGRREHRHLQAVDRRLLSRGPPSNLRRRARGVHHRGLPDGRRACAPLPLRGVHDASLHQAGVGNPFLRGLRRHSGADGGLLHRARSVRPRRVVLGALARTGRRCGAAPAARRGAAGDAEHLHVVSLADADLAQRELRVGSAGDGLDVRPAGVPAGQSVAGDRGLADRGDSHVLQAALLHRERSSLVAGAAVVFSRTARGSAGEPCGQFLPPPCTA